MTQTKDGSTVKMNYVYNGRGEQVRKYLSTTNTYTMYDEAGHWIGDYANAGVTAPTQQAIWLGDLPVGVFVGAGASQKLYYVEPDALGTPRVVIDPTRGSSGTTVWKWDLAGEAFGTTAPNQDPDGDATQFVFNLRFPGQRYDAASGLNYNYFRDYDPTTGRYVESDPIGLAGGMTSFGYANSSPLVLSDILGLSASGGSDTCVGVSYEVCRALRERNHSGSAFSSYYGWEVLIGLYGFGRVTLSCEDECGKIHHYVFKKHCYGVGLGFGATLGGVHGVNGTECDPNKYKGWFGEGGVSVGPVGFGMDVGFDEGGVQIPFTNHRSPSALSGVYEGGVGVAIGDKYKGMFCYYVPVAE